MANFSRLHCLAIPVHSNISPNGSTHISQAGTNLSLKYPAYKLFLLFQLQFNSTLTEGGVRGIRIPQNRTE